MANPIQNKLLNALSAERKNRLFPQLKLVELPLRKVIYDAGQSIISVYFPTNSIISLLYVMKDGASAEISVVGNEGLVGIAVFIGEKARQIAQ